MCLYFSSIFTDPAIWGWIHYLWSSHSLGLHPALQRPGQSYSSRNAPLPYSHLWLFDELKWPAWFHKLIHFSQETIGELPKGPEPPFFDEDKLFNQVKDPIADVAQANTTFGDVLQQVNSIYKVVGQ